MASDHPPFGRTDELLLLALHAAQLGAWETDLETGENAWHAGMAHLLGVPAECAHVEARRFLEYIHHEDRDGVIAAFEEARRSTEAGRIWEADFRVRRADGVERWFNSRGMVVDGAGMHRRMVGVAQDITERKAAEHRLAEQARLLDLSNDAIVVRALDARSPRSSRPTAHRTWASASASRSRVPSSSCTAAPSRRTAADAAKGRPSRCACRSPGKMRGAPRWRGKPR